MKQYLDIIEKVLDHGVKRVNRTDQVDWFIPSATIEHDLREGFPALTTKQLFYKQSIGEILGFIRGYDNAEDFAKLGCRFWFSDANENKTWLASPYRKGENDVGKIYGSTWRKRTVYKETEDWSTCEYLWDHGWRIITMDKGITGDNWIHGKEVDQLQDVVSSIINNPNDRRIIMHAWFPELFDEMALVPCHCLYRFIPDETNKVLHMTMFQRSCDLFLGVPMNLFGSALLLQLVANATGYTAGVFTHQMADVHLYEQSIVSATEQLQNEPCELPNISMRNVEPRDVTVHSAMEYLEGIEPSEIELNNYRFTKLRSGRVPMAQER